MLDRSKSFKLMLGSGCALSVLAAASGTLAEERTFNVPASDAVSAIPAFAQQAGLQIVAPADQLKGVATPAIKGRLDTRVALSQLISRTGLRIASDDGRTVTLAASPQGESAGGGAETNVVQELVVTAQKKSENIQVVPIAISAFTQEDLTTRQVAGGPDLMTQVPNMTFTKTNFSSYSIQIRGIGTQAISATVDPAVAVAFNNTPFIRNRFFEQEFYDLERVEVLRGPQGTLYGRNATAGVVNILSAKPTFEYDAKVSADVSNYSSRRLEAMVNLPLVDDKVAMRLAGAWTKRDGYVTNEITGNPIDGRDLWSTRLSLRFAPNDRIDANLIWEHFQEDDDRLRSGKQLCKKDSAPVIGGVVLTDYDQGPAGPVAAQYSQGCTPASLYSPDSFQTPNGLTLGFYGPLGAIGLPIAPGAGDPYLRGVQSHDLRVIESTVDPSYKAKSDVVELQVKFDLSDTLSLSSETAWSSDFLFSSEDYNRFNTKPGAWAQTTDRPNLLNNGVFCDPQIGCSDRLVAIDLSTARSQDFSQEFRLSSNYDGKFNFSLGANFLRYDTEDKYYVFINSFALWGATTFQSSITSPWIPGVSQNLECLKDGFKPVDPSSGGGVPVTGGLGCLYIDPNPIGSLNDLGHNYFLSKNPYKLISYAAFGEGYYNITDTLKLTAGLRWTVDQKQAPRIPSWLLSKGLGYPVFEVVQQEWRQPTGRLTLDWKPDLGFTEQTLLYASYAHGYKAGGANPPPAAVALNVNVGAGVPTPSDTHPLTFKAEYVDALEIGAKNTLLDGKLTFNATAFYYDYKGYQLSQIVDRSAITKNFDADIWGVEIESDWRPLKNLRLGFKGGYEGTKVAKGMSAVDVMDRTAGHTDWVVVKPFPVYPSNCIVPVYVVLYESVEGAGKSIHQLGNGAGSDQGPCNMPYFEGLDPITSQPYVPNPTPLNAQWFYTNGGSGTFYPHYIGFNPATAPNNGEGFSKDLSGHELPNAPHFTATITADYTLPLPADWLVTLHTDLYYQSEAWTRIFNTPGYDRLKAYSNINVAAIFTNEAAGWRVMAYVKNVLDRDSITGAFLNSDDSGLTTNVFLTEPRLYGLRVTKEFNGGPWPTGAGSNHTPGAPYPFTIEIGGQIQHQDAPYDPSRPITWADAIRPALDIFDQSQNTGLDWGDGRELKATWRPDGGLWNISAGVRYGRTNGSGPRLRAEEKTPEACAFGGPYLAYCPLVVEKYGHRDRYYATATDWAEAYAVNRERHELVDFAIGRDIGIGGLSHSTVSLGVGNARFDSTTTTAFGSLPDWLIVDGWFLPGYPAFHSRFSSDLKAERKFNGTGPKISWSASRRILGNEDKGHVDIDWSVGGGALFGKQKTSITGSEVSSRYEIPGIALLLTDGWQPPIAPPTTTPINIVRSRSVTAPVVDLSLGLSYEIQRVKVSTGYRWERYFNFLDAGFAEHKSYDRTMDGPYVKVSVGFGG